MKIPSPPELGLPEKFDQWRPSQAELIDVIITSRQRSVVACAPTGMGKSVVAVGAAKFSGLPTCIITATRGLETQYTEDFSSAGLVDIRGRANYVCDMRPDEWSCEEGHAARCPYVGTVGCPSSQAEMAAATSPLVVTNYAKWVAAGRSGSNFPKRFGQVMFDEAHHAPDALSQAMQVVLTQHEVEEVLKVPFPVGVHADNMHEWRSWAEPTRVVSEIAVYAAKERIKGLSNPKSSWVKHFTHMRNLNQKLNIIATCRPDDWVVEEIDKGYQFDPIRPARYAETTLLFKIPKLVFISATIRPKTMFMLGQAKESFVFREFGSDFDPKRAPIYYIPTARVDYRNADDIGLIWLKLDQIAARRRDRKGIVQTVSFTRQRDVLRASRFSDSMIVNERGEPPTQIIEEFARSGPGTILVSPSIGTGYDFRDDLARWNFICKIPFDPPSKILKARQEDDPDYRSYRAVQTLVQNFGRTVRSKSDWAEGFICDAHLTWFWPRYSYLAPKWFHSFMKQVDTVPPPPKIEEMVA